MQKQEVKRQEVEELLGFGITDEQLREALECARHNMEKEHSASCQSAPTDNHIVAVPAG